MPSTRLALALAVAVVCSVAPAVSSAEPAVSVLQVSARPDRSEPVPLGAAAVPQPAYVVLADAPPARRVIFSVDGVAVRNDYRAPFDLRGNRADGTARPIFLSPGPHEVVASVLGVTGTLTTVSARFDVGGPVDGVGFSVGAGRPFGVGSAFNVPIPADPVVDPLSRVWAGQLGASGNVQAALLDETGVAVYDADGSTPRFQVRCTEPWGSCPLAAGPVPVPVGARAPVGADGAMVVIDWSTRRVYEFWQARRTGDGGWVASWGSVNSIDGDGYDASGASPTGAGISRLAGVVRLREVAAGRIDHALVFATGISAPGVFRYPASKTDGINMFGSSAPLPEGARVQLDPSIDVAALPGITPAEVAVARALQTYGAYNIDNGGYRAMGFSFQSPGPGQSSPYAAQGLGWDYAGMPHIPWDRLRVLRQWDGR